MAEFCKKCAPKYRMLADELPLLCEGCGEYYEDDDVSIWVNYIYAYKKLSSQIQ